MAKIERVLVIGPSWVGDMVMAHTLLQRIKRDYIDVTIDVLAPKHSHPVLERMPEVANIIPITIEHGQIALRERWRMGRYLRRKRYDRAFILPNSFKSALIPFFAGIPKRTGWLGEFRYGLLTETQRLKKQNFPYMIQRFAQLLEMWSDDPEPIEQLPFPRFSIDQAKVNATLTRLGIKRPTQPILALCHGAEYGPAKRWPAEHFAAVAKQKIAEGWQVWLFGSPKEQETAEKIQQLTDNQCFDLTGKTKLAEAIDCLSLAKQVVCNDSGLMHIAAALNIPLVAVYGSSSPGFTPALTKKKIILSENLSCSPCFKRECPLGHLHCLNQLSPDKVLKALSDPILS